MKDRTGAEYPLSVDTASSCSMPFDFRAVLRNPSSKKEVARLVYWKEDFIEPKVPWTFLDMPRVWSELPFYRSEVTVDPAFQSRGLGGQLARLLIAQLSGITGEHIHIDYFTPDGLRYLWPYFSSQGYMQANIRDEFLASQFTGPRPHTWMYRHYS